MAIFNANDYCFFKENRNPIGPTKFNKLRKALKDTGYCIMPIIVMPVGHSKDLVDIDGNPTTADKHKYAVIDGQNRLLACIAEGLTPWTIVNSYASREDVITANNTSSPWQLIDFIEYWKIRYEDEDNYHYDDLLSAFKTYSNTMSKEGLFAPGVVAESFSSVGSSYKKAIEDGEYEFDLDKGQSMLETAKLFAEIKDTVGDLFKFNHQRFVRAVGVVLRDEPDFDFEKAAAVLRRDMRRGLKFEIAKEGIIVKNLKSLLL